MNIPHVEFRLSLVQARSVKRLQTFETEAKRDKGVRMQTRTLRDEY